MSDRLSDFKNKFGIHESDIRTKKDRSGTARRFNNKCCDQHDSHK